MFTTDTKKLYVGDGSTPGGILVDMNTDTGTGDTGSGSDGSDAPVQSVAGRTGDVVLTKADVGLSNVPNTDFTSAVNANTAKISYTDGAKVAGIQAGATANSPDATLLARGNHTGSQPISTITNLQAALDAKQVAGDYATSADVEISLNNKVDKITGKQLSTEDYTSAEKTKLAGVEAGAQVNDTHAINDLTDVTITTPSTGQVLKFNGTEWVNDTDATGTGGTGGVTDHGALTGLGDDDHTQYHNDARGDARYYTQTQVDTALSGKQATGDYATNTALTNGLTGKSDTTHNHDDRYYTETETDTLLTSKANSTHTHPASDMTATGTRSSATYLRGDNTWSTPTNTTYSEITSAEITGGTATTLRTMTGRRAQEIVNKAVASVPTNADTVDSFHASATPTADAILPLDNQKILNANSIGSTIVIAENTSQLTFGGTTKTRWMDGVWTQHGLLAASTSLHTVQITVPTGKQYTVGLRHMCSTVGSPNGHWSHSGLAKLNASNVMTTFLTSSLNANGDNYHPQTTECVQVLGAGTHNFCVWVRTNTTTASTWYGGGDSTNTTSSFNFGRSVVVTATLLDVKSV